MNILIPSKEEFDHEEFKKRSKSSIYSFFYKAFSDEESLPSIILVTIICVVFFVVFSFATANTTQNDITLCNGFTYTEIEYVETYIDYDTSVAISQMKKQEYIDNYNKPIDINTATYHDLVKIDGIGDKRAKLIIDYRTKNGDFQTVNDLTKISGIGEILLDKWRDKLMVPNGN